MDEEAEKVMRHPSGWTLMSIEQVCDFLNGYFVPEQVVDTEHGIWYLDKSRRRSDASPNLTIVKENDNA